MVTTSEKPKITAAVSETTTYTGSSGKTLVKTPTTGWQYVGGGQPSEKEVIEASGSLSTAQKIAKAKYEASKPADVPKQQLIDELAAKKEDVLAQAEAIRMERQTLGKEDYDKSQALMSQEVALRNESSMLNNILRGQERSPTGVKGSMPYSQYQNTINRVEAWEKLRPFIIGNPQTGQVTIATTSAFAIGLGDYQPSADRVVDQSRRVKSVEAALTAIGLPQEALMQAKQEYYSYNRQVLEAVKLAEKEWESNTILLKTGERVETKDFYGLNDREKRYLLDNGIDKFNDWQVVLAKVQINAVNQLEKYTADGKTYDIAKFLKDNPGGGATLKEAGFSQTDIDNAKAYNELPWVVETSREKYENAILAAGGRLNYTQQEWDAFFVKHPEIKAMQTGLLKEPAGGYPKPELSLQAFTVNFLAARGYEDVSFMKSPTEWKNNIAEVGRLKALAEAEYSRLYGVDATFESKGIGALSFVFEPARVAHPEVTVKDISAAEWAFGAAQLATLAFPFVNAGTRAALSGVAGGIFTYNTVQNWSSMSTAERVLSVAVDVAVLFPLGRMLASEVKISTVKIPVKAGYEMKPITGELVPVTQDKVVWKGLTLFGKPVLGKAPGGRLAIGGRGASYPTYTEIIKPYEPGVSKVETNIMTTHNALEKMGVPEAEIAKLKATLRAEQSFLGKKSPYLSKELQPEAIKNLGADGVSAVLDEIVKAKDKIRIVYGSTTIKPQLAPELRSWRTPADIDIMTNLNLDDTASFARKLFNRLEPIVGKGNIRINPELPTLIETKVKGQWHHALDIHSYEVAPGSQPALEGAYGRPFAEPAIKANYPGIGEVDIMRLSETGARKAASILEWTYIDGEPGFAPQAHRIKDIVDFYVIVRTFKGEGLANQWAKLFGYNPEQLLALAKEFPIEPVAWSFSPAEVSKAVSGMAMPSIAIALPSTLLGAMQSSPKASALLKQITGSVSPYTLASPSEVVSSLSPTISQIKVSNPPRIQPSVSKAVSVSPSGKASISPSPVVSVATSPSVSVSKTPSPAPSTSPSPSPPSRAVTTPTPSTSPLPSKSPTTSPAPSPAVIVSPRPNRRIVLSSSGAIETTPRHSEGAVAWKQGRLKKRGGGTADHWVIITPPYEGVGEPTVRHVISDIPPKGVRIAEDAKTAYASIQATGKLATAAQFTVDMGIMDVKVDQPVQEPGKVGAISFTPDLEQETVSDVVMGEQPKVRSIRGTSAESATKLALSTTLEDLFVRKYTKTQLQKFAEKRSLPRLLRKATPAQIVKLLVRLVKQGRISKAKALTLLKKIYKALPDRKAAELRAYYEEWQETGGNEYAPTRGYPQAERLPSKLRRSKVKATSSKASGNGASKLRPTTSVVSTYLGSVDDLRGVI